MAQIKQTFVILSLFVAPLCAYDAAPIEKLLPPGKEFLPAVRGGSSFRKSTDSSLDPVLQDRDYVELPVHKQQISYLMQSRQFDASLNLYQEYRASIGRHDFEILEQIAMILLIEGARSGNPEVEMSTLFGAHLGGLSHAIDILDIGINSAHPQVQTAAIQFLGSLQDDRCDALLIRSMASEFFSVRMDAAYLLALRKHKVALGQIEALMYRVPPTATRIFSRALCPDRDK